jgi:solute carrier family 25 oxoglutarate transporter 11
MGDAPKPRPGWVRHAPTALPVSLSLSLSRPRAARSLRTRERAERRTCAKAASSASQVNFAVGAASALSGWMFVHPADLLKVRQQLAGEAGVTTPLGKLAKDIVAKDGVKGLYGGLSAAVARQLSYGNMRLGFYQTFKDMAYPGKAEPGPVPKLGLGLCAGGCAAALANPIEVALVRMQADGRLPVEKQRNYSNIFNALMRIGKEEGVAAYMAGVGPTVVRAMVVNMLQVGGYDIAKTTYSGMGVTGVPLHITSALTAGFVYSAATLPIDTAKTRMQNQVANAAGELPYKSLPQTISKIAGKKRRYCILLYAPPPPPPPRWLALPFACMCGEAHFLCLYLSLARGGWQPALPVWTVPFSCK